MGYTREEMMGTNNRLLMDEPSAKQVFATFNKVYTTIEKYGNSSAASLPIALDEANREGRLQKGDLLLFSVFGGGFTWGVVLWRW